MFGLGPTELIVILILGLLVLGPERIPGVASSLGKAIRSFRRATRDLRDQIDLEDDVRRPFEDLRAALRDEPPPPPPPFIAPTIAPPLDPPLAAPIGSAEAAAEVAALVPPPGVGVVSLVAASSEVDSHTATPGDAAPHASEAAK
jgi:TatA/E family protein of Tat protein translocase